MIVPASRPGDPTLAGPHVLFVVLYVTAVVAANLSVAAFGPTSVYINAFLFIGLTLTTRDRLHEYWQGRRLAPKMGAVILTGALLSWLINQDAGLIAIASLVAFLATETMDTIVYHTLRHRPWMVKANGSNLFSAAIDSIVFPTIAFGALLPGVIAGQFAAKVLGGFFWALLMMRWMQVRRPVPAPAPVAAAELR